MIGEPDRLDRPSQPGRLQDAAGRIMRKLRVSLTDACNFRCTYCMPADPVFTPRHALLRPPEFERIGSLLVGMGLDEIRVTGGEPTLRPDFRDILESLARIHAGRLGITSNGQLLEPHLAFARELGWRSLNISLDSLDPGKFDRITGGGDLRKVLDCIYSAAAMGFEVKVNVVVLKDINDDELLDFTAWGARQGIEVRFLELMKVGPQAGSHGKRFLSAREMQERLLRATSLRALPTARDSTAFLFESDSGARIGFIASESMPFCGQCSRLRLSATGVLRSCLMDPFGVSLREARPEEYPAILERVMARKPLSRLEQVDEPMHAIGG